MKSKVENMTSRNGNKVANQFVITSYDDNHSVSKKIFQSYETTIAITNYVCGRPTDPHTLILDRKMWDYSKTTMKYLNQFLSGIVSHPMPKKKIEEFIKDNRIILQDLNNGGK